MTPRLRIDEFAKMAHPHDGHRKIFAMIEAYLDESGIHDGASVCVIAGYFATAREWRKFEADWQKLLHNHLVPLQKFHAKDLFKKTGFFHKWSDGSYHAFVNGVLDTILSHKAYPVSSGIIIEDFESFSLDEKKFMTVATLFHRTAKLEGGCPTKPYFVPFQLCVRTIAAYTPRRWRAHFYFGLDRNFYSYANALFRDMKMKAPISWREKLGDPAFPLAAETPELQAADVLAYLTYTHMKKHFHSRTWTVQPESRLAYLLQRAKSRGDFRCFDKAALHSMLKELGDTRKRLGFENAI